MIENYLYSEDLGPNYKLVKQVADKARYQVLKFYYIHVCEVSTKKYSHATLQISGTSGRPTMLLLVALTVIFLIRPEKNNYWFPIADRPLPMFATH